MSIRIDTYLHVSIHIYTYLYVSIRVFTYIYTQNVSLHVYVGIYVYLSINAVCCSDINIEDVVLSNMRGDIAEHTAYTQCFLV